MDESTGRCDVLVVDDEEVVRSGVARILSPNGLTVTAVGTAGDAIAHPDLTRCRLVLCDLMLPDLPGTHVLAALRERGLTTPVVVMTGYLTNDSVAAALAAGASGVLAKPFDEEELLSEVARALGAAGGDKP